MLVDESRCVGCGNCVALCPVSAISVWPDRRAVIGQDECVECGVCERALRKERLNPTAVRLVDWLKADGKSANLVRRLHESYEVTRQEAERDVDAFLAALRTHDLL